MLEPFRYGDTVCYTLTGHIPIGDDGINQLKSESLRRRRHRSS